MLEPRQADLPALFLVLVVLPVVLYILLGKWSEASSNRKERINLVVKEAFVESITPEEMAATSVISSVAPAPTTPFRECARCGSPATTRCSRCKSVRYWYVHIVVLMQFSDILNFLVVVLCQKKTYLIWKA